MRSLISQFYLWGYGLLQRFPAQTLSMLAMAFYIYTLAPSLNWADEGRMQMDVMLKGSSYRYMEELAGTPTDGLPFDHLGAAAWDHPLYVMVAQFFLLIPKIEPTFLINLLSAVAAALSVGLTFQLAVYLLHDHWAAAVAALSLAVSHTFWFHAVTSNPYTLNILFMAVLIKLVITYTQEQDWRTLCASALVAGLGVANHRLFALIVPLAGIFVIVMVHERARFVKDLLGRKGVWIVVLFLAGLAPWWVQFLRTARIIGIPLTWQLAGTFSLIGSRLAVGSWEKFLMNLVGYAGWLLYQFTPLGVLLGVLGFKWMWESRPRVALFLLAILVAYVLFSANFSVADRFAFHLPSYWVFSLGIACGAHWVHSRLSTGYFRIAGLIRNGLVAITIILPIGIYAITPPALGWFGVTERDFGIYPIGIGVRDTARYFLNPNKRGDDSAARFGRTTLRELAPQALVLTPKTSEQEAYVILRYFQLVEGMRPDVRIDMMLFSQIDNMPRAVLALVNEQIGCRPIYVSSLNPASFPVSSLEASYDVIPEANLYRLMPRNLLPVSSSCLELAAESRGISLRDLILRALRWP